MLLDRFTNGLEVDCVDAGEYWSHHQVYNHLLIFRQQLSTSTAATVNLRAARLELKATGSPDPTLSEDATPRESKLLDKGEHMNFGSTLSSTLLTSLCQQRCVRPTAESSVHQASKIYLHNLPNFLDI